MDHAPNALMNARPCPALLNATRILGRIDIRADPRQQMALRIQFPDATCILRLASMSGRTRTQLSKSG